MLSRLSVQNLAVVESAAMEFGGGLNIITGETGAGKSVLMGALGLVLGARADASSVRDGAKDARIEAEFALKGDPSRQVAALLDEYGLPPVEDGVLLVRRVISSSGGGRVWVNDAATTVQTLRALGRMLVDVHGPNDHQSLLDEAFQRRLLDSYGKVDVEAYSKEWRSLSDLRGRLAELQGDTSDVAGECERLRYAVDEIDAAQLTDEDETELPARHAAAAHAAVVAVFKEHRVAKTYRTVVHGRWDAASSTIDLPLDGRRALSQIHCLRANAKASHLAVRIETGRTHQIRRHLAMARHPVLGDATYGPKVVEDLRLMKLTYPLLHAVELEMDHPTRPGELLRVFSPLPQDFHRWLGILRLE